MRRHVWRNGAVIGAWVGAFALWTPALAQKRPAQRLAYDEILTRSTLVVMGDVLSSQVVELKNRPGPMPPPQVIEINGRPLTIYPDTSSWKRAALMDPPRLYALRIQLRAEAGFQGGAKAGDVLAVNLWYGVDRGIIPGEWDGYRRTYLKPDDPTILTLHLRPVPKDLRASSKPVYELVTKPWLVRPDERAQRQQDMRLRMRRFAAFKEIDALLRPGRTLSSAEFARIKRLALSEEPDLGTIRWSVGEQALLDRLFVQSGPSPPSLDELRLWWESEKHGFIELPVRILIDRSKK